MFQFAVACVVMEKKRKNISTATGSRSETTPLLRIIGRLKKICFALYGSCHKASDTVRSLSMSSELKKKKKKKGSPVLSEKCFTSQLVLLLRFQTGDCTCGNRSDLSRSSLSTKGAGMFSGREMLMELDPEPHRGAGILSTPCTLTNLFLLCYPCARKQFF